MGVSPPNPKRIKMASDSLQIITLKELHTAPSTNQKKSQSPRNLNDHRQPTKALESFTQLLPSNGLYVDRGVGG
jgi:hypothetical protein